MEIIGAYPVPEAKQPVTLIEVWVKDFHGTLDFGNFKQTASSLRPADAQSAYLEHRLSEDGTSGEDVSLQDVAVQGSGRFAFFIHYMQLDQPLETPFGPIRIPQLKPRPARLAFIEYDEPD